MYKKFLLKTLIGVILLLAVDFFAGFLLKTLYTKQKAGEYYKANYSIDSTKASFIILGSSRASHHYVSNLLKDAVGIDCYNTGRDGIGLLYNYAILKSIVKRYSPKIIILDLSPKSLYYEAEEYEKLSLLLPYYKSHPEIREIVDLKSPLEKYKLFSAIYPFNSELVSLLKGKFFVNTEINNLNGYDPLKGKMKKAIGSDKSTESRNKLDSNKINSLGAIANICKENKIKLFLVYSPIYNNSQDSSANAEIVKVEKQYKATYWDFSQDTTFDNHVEYFKNSNHLNHNGAQLFSQVLAKKLLLNLSRDTIK